MKTYNATNRTSPQLKKAIKNVLEYHERYKNSYFWTGTGNASNRRFQEQQFTSENPEFKIIDGDKEIQVIPKLTISVRNYYYSLYISVNGVKKDIRALKNYIK